MDSFMPLNINVFVTNVAIVWNIIVKLFLKHPALPMQATLHPNY
jgi:hypothetical protein